VLGGRGLPAAIVERPGLRVAERVGDVVPLVDSLVQRASMN
jgi:hypothetical protein